MNSGHKNRTLGPVLLDWVCSGRVEFNRVWQGSVLGGLKFSQRLANDLLGKAGAFAALAGHVGGGSDFLVAAASFIDRIADLSVGDADTKTHIHRETIAG